MKIPCIPTVLTSLVFAASLAASAQETQVQFLSGHGMDDAVPWKFFCTAGANSGFWTNLPVPSQWDVKGFGTLNYYRDATNPPPESGLYEHEFTVPADWAGQRLFLVFEGSMTDTSAKLNGESVGPVHQGSFYRFKYEVTKLVKPGAVNKLEVRVDKHSANKSVNDAERTADYWVFGGIFRPVHLDAVPPQFIDRVAIDAKADGAFAMDVYADDATGADTIEAQIKTLDGKSVGNLVSEKISGARTTLKAQIASPKQWTAETPNLYRVEVALKQNGKVIHQTSERFGFRTMEVREGDGLYVNGRKVILKGATRHSFWPDSGRTLSEAVHRLDIEALKDANMNAVRMSHYPPDVQFLDLCDELGLYVLDELGGWHQHYATEVGTKLVEEMVTRDVNHPSILFWDNGNEGGWNTNLDDIFGLFDPQQRHVLHPWAVHGGLNTAHYKTYDQAKALVAGNTIYMPTEFEHGLYDGGAGAGLEDYWKLMMSSKIGAGGFIWSLVDEGVKRPDTGKIDVAGNQAPDGIAGPYREREGSFYTVKQLWSPIQVTCVDPGVFAIENHYSFTDANQCKFTRQILRYNPAGKPTVLKEEKLPVKSIPPGTRGREALMPAAIPPDADALSIRVDDPTGRELWTWVWPLHDIKTFGTTPGNSSPATVTDAGEVFQLKAGNLTVGIDRLTGLLGSVERGGQKFSFANGPRAVVGESKLTGLETTTSGSGAMMTATYDGALKKVTWHLRGDGWLQCDYTYTATGSHEAIGVAFDYPEQFVTGKRWLGNGPYRVWKNRIPGTTLGVWENAYNNTITGYRDWVYPEFKGCFAYVYWMQLQTTQGLITAIPSRHDGFVQVLTPELPPAALVAKTKTTLPSAGLAFLDAIPPIGSKFHDARDIGPQSQPNIATGEYSGSVSFYFGKLP